MRVSLIITVVAISSSASIACSASPGAPSGAETGTGGTAALGSGGATETGGDISTGGSPSGGSAGVPGAGGDPGDPGEPGGSGAPGSGGATAPSGACTNGGDQSIFNSLDVSAVVGSCALNNLGGEPGTRNCIKQQTNLSDPCVDCFDGAVQCGAANCWLQCISDSNSPDCVSCRKQYCDPRVFCLQRVDAELMGGRTGFSGGDLVRKLSYKGTSAKRS